MFRTKVTVAIITLLFLQFDGLAQSKVGTTAANFLLIGVGARGIALGEAASASGADISSAYWNPALTAHEEQSQVFFNHTNWFANIDLNYGSAFLNFGQVGNFGLTFYSLGTEPMEITTEQYPEGTGELFEVQDLMVALSYSRGLTDRFAMGASIKGIYSQIWNTSASAVAVDVGLTYRTPFSPITLGMSINNFGSEMRMNGSDLAVRFDPDLLVGGNNDGVVAYQGTRSWDLPIMFRFGGALDVIDTEEHKILLLGDVIYPSSNYNYANFGMEYGFMDMVFLRGGFRERFLDDREGGLSLGAGAKVYNVNVDYAYSDRGILNDVQYFSVGFSF